MTGNTYETSEELVEAVVDALVTGLGATPVGVDDESEDDEFAAGEFITQEMIDDAAHLGVEVGDVWLRDISGTDDRPAPLLDRGETISPAIAERLVAYYRADVEREVAETMFVARENDPTLQDEDFQVNIFTARNLTRFGVKGAPYTRGHCDSSVALGTVTWIEGGELATRVILLDWESGEVF